MKLALLISTFLFCQSGYSAWNNPQSRADEDNILENIIDRNPGFDLAHTYRGINDEELENPTEGSYVFYDMNDDGRMDLAIILERTTCSDTSKKVIRCETWGSKDRKLLIYFQQWDGSFKMVGKSANSMLNQGQGGEAVPNGDPLQPLEVDMDRDSLKVSYRGGSTQEKWTVELLIRYQRVPKNGYGFYLIQKDFRLVTTGNWEGERMILVKKHSHNLETGEVMESIAPLLDSSIDPMTRSYNDPQALKRFSQLTQEDFFGGLF